MRNDYLPGLVVTIAVVKYLTQLIANMNKGKPAFLVVSANFPLGRTSLLLKYLRVVSIDVLAILEKSIQKNIPK